MPLHNRFFLVTSLSCRVAKGSLTASTAQLHSGTGQLSLVYLVLNKLRTICVASLNKDKLLLLAETTKFKCKRLWDGVRVSILLVAFPPLHPTTCHNNLYSWPTICLVLLPLREVAPHLLWFPKLFGVFHFAFITAGPSYHIQLHTHSIVLVLCKAPQQNFLVHVKGSLYSGMSFQEERRHITPTICVRSLPLLRRRPSSSPFNTLWSTYVEADNNIHLMLCFTMGKVHKWESSLNVGPKSATCPLGPLFCKCPHSPALPYTPYSILLFFLFFF
jgi:hypothetical protein